MTKKELMEYLKAINDVEGAVYFYEEATRRLRQNRSAMKRIAVRPERETPCIAPKERQFYEHGIGYWISGVFWLGFWIFDCMQHGSFIKETFRCQTAWLGVIVYPLLGYGCGWILQWVGFLVFDIILESIFDFQKTKKAAEDSVVIAEQSYENKMRIYKEACALEEKAEREMDTAIDELNTKYEEVKKQRDKLYAMNVLHPSFQNVIAVNRIRDYLEMGICDRLEGANGAYAQYMQDVRVNRICKSVDELRQTVEKGFNEIKGKLSAFMVEMRRTNANIDALNANISSEFSNMQRLISEGQKRSDAHLQADLKEANGYLRSISKTLQDAGHNEYIALKEANVSSYLRRIY